MYHQFLGAFARLGKANINFVMSVRPFVRLQQRGSHWTDFNDIFFLEHFSKISLQNLSF